MALFLALFAVFVVAVIFTPQEVGFGMLAGAWMVITFKELIDGEPWKTIIADVLFTLVLGAVAIDGI